MQAYVLSHLIQTATLLLRYYNWAWTPDFWKENNKTQKEVTATF